MTDVYAAVPFPPFVKTFGSKVETRGPEVEIFRPFAWAPDMETSIARGRRGVNGQTINGSPFIRKSGLIPRSSAPAEIKQRLQKFGIKPDGIINFLSNEPPFRYSPALKIPRSSAPRRLIVWPWSLRKAQTPGHVDGGTVWLAHWGRGATTWPPRGRGALAVKRKQSCRAFFSSPPCQYVVGYTGIIPKQYIFIIRPYVNIFRC